MRAKVDNEKGMLNIITAALALPILLLLSAAAMDVVRFPVVKQHLYSSLQAGFDALAIEGANGWEIASGQNLCLLTGNNSESEKCPRCKRRIKKNCSGARDDHAASTALKNAVELLFAENTKGGFGILSHKPKGGIRGCIHIQSDSRRFWQNCR